MDTTLGEGNDTTIMILDAISLRRAGFSSLLAGWAQSKGLTLKSSDLTESDLVDRCKMLVLCIGSRTFDDANLVQQIKAIQAQRPEAIPVVISDRDEPDEMVRAFQVGFRGFIPTGLEPPIVFQALNFIMNGGWFLPQTILHRFLAPTDIALNGSLQRAEGGQGSEVRPVHGLTVRQHEVIELLRRGISNKVIGRELQMTEATVKVHVRQIMRKLGASNRTQAALIFAVGLQSRTSDLN
jgi:DNA-binding NarL/FixJ family response regulator